MTKVYKCFISLCRFLSKKEAKFKMSELLLPAQSLLQAVHRLAGGVQDTLPVPDPHLPGPGLRTDGADGKQLPITTPRHPRPAVVPGCSRLHLLQVKVSNHSHNLARTDDDVMFPS